jgi:hypothetical protein
MRISLTRLPFYSVCVAAVLPWVNALANSNVPGYVFDLMLISVAGISLALNPNLSFRLRPSSWLYSVCFGFGLGALFILHQMHFLNAFLVVVPVTFAYVLFLGDRSVTPGELRRQLTWLYAFHLLFIGVELLMYFLDLQSVFRMIAGDRYRELPFHLLGRLALDIGNGAPNSLLLQAQAASHLVVCALLFAYLASAGKRGVRDWLVLIGLLLLFLLLITNTSLLILVVLAFALWVVRSSWSARVVGLMLALLAAWILQDQLLSIVLYRVQEQQLLDLYIWYFTVAFSNVWDAQLMQFLFGHGVDRDALESGELGFVTVAFIGGVYVVGLLSIWLLSILGRGLLTYRRNRNSADPDAAAWSALLFVGVVLSVAWIMSTAHYLILLIPGGLHLFAFGLAIVIRASTELAKRRVRVARKIAPGNVDRLGAELSPG